MGSRLDGWLVGEVEERRAWQPFGDDEALVAWRLPCSVLRRCCGGPNEQTDKGRVATSSQGVPREGARQGGRVVSYRAVPGRRARAAPPFRYRALRRDLDRSVAGPAGPLEILACRPAGWRVWLDGDHPTCHSAELGGVHLASMSRLSSVCLVVVVVAQQWAQLAVIVPSSLSVRSTLSHNPGVLSVSRSPISVANRAGAPSFLWGLSAPTETDRLQGPTGSIAAPSNPLRWDGITHTRTDIQTGLRPSLSPECKQTPHHPRGCVGRRATRRETPSTNRPALSAGGLRLRLRRTQHPGLCPCVARRTRV